ncbi:fluoride efflux transporter CrcB [Streptococcus sciuri]|uniref:Fluoride-specific ion channel FluC n=1 Tax=Streptococcus sciuri TaxID=2973939 RepID=A0ABT2F4P9_9STRE|nr:fluoride efflux transporter CrcB [Streptococcus sciuri]MCS4487372.1 fluoride efflux transporter CrcB [Streptococcus sciuri]
MTSLRESVIIFIGALFGGLSRYLFGLLFPTLYGLSIDTLIINYLGTFLLVFCIKGYLSRKGLSSAWQLALGTGFCGSFTTFSSAMLDLFKFVETGRYLVFFCYSVLLVFGGLGVAYLSYYLLEKLEK